MKEKFERFIEKVNNYFSLPIIVCILLSVISDKVKNTPLRTVMEWAITIFIILYIFFIISLMCKKLIKDKFMITMLILSLVLFVISFIVSFAGVVNIEIWLFVFGTILLEVYLLSIIINRCFSKSKNIGVTILFSLIFIIFGFFTIYLSTYDATDNTLFNALITIFAAVIGGAVTLVGVAWTINNNKEEKRKEEIEKAMPYFTFNIVRNVPENIDGLKICFPEELELNYGCDTYGEIENSNHSVVILKKIYHDGKWFPLQCNNTLIHNGKLILNFKFSDPNGIVLEVSDTLGNLYYYKLNVLHMGLINGNVNSSIHTIRGIKKIK